jgi:hypothetical protein
MTFDPDPTLHDMIRASYRLSWPGPAPRHQTPLHRLVVRATALCRREKLTGWPIALSAPQEV